MGKQQPTADRSKQAFEDLYDRCDRRLLLHLARRMQDVDAATELWAESWAVAFAAWPRCRAATVGESEAWLFGIAHKLLAGYYRSGAVSRRGLDQLRWIVPTIADADYEDLARDAGLAELRDVLKRALTALPEMRRRAIEFRILAGLSYAEVAARLGCSEEAARAHVSRGLRQLERQMNREQIRDLQGVIR
jgi:RNA polymerase sigma factor (sigma-70 family)